MKKSLLNTGILLSLALIVAGIGYYETSVRQPESLAQIENQYKEASRRNLQVEELLQAEASTAEQAEETLRKWKARYKIVPAEMETPDIVQYLERLTTNGFDQLVIDLDGVTRRPTISYYTFTISGMAYFRNLYDFVWRLENNREFYHVRDLTLRHETIVQTNPSTGRDRRLDMVGFSLKLDAFFAGTEGISPDTGDLLPIPRSMLPVHTPAHDSFFPLVRTDLPMNDRGLVDLERAKLVSIVGGQAIFEDAAGRRSLAEGDEVYLGTIVKVDPVRAYVRASLNKGGVIDVVEIPLSVEQQLRLPGDVRRTPIQREGG